VLLLALMGLLHLMNDWPLLGPVRTHMAAESVGGTVGRIMYDYFLWMLGSVGAAIVCGTFYLISLLCLTNFQLGAWLTDWWAQRKERAEGLGADERLLEHKARELEKRKRALEEEVERAGLGADLQPVPKPTVRDLTVPQIKPDQRGKKQPEATAVAEPEREAAAPREVGKATTAEAIGREPEKIGEVEAGEEGLAEAAAEAQPATAKADEAKAEDAVTPVVAPGAPPKPKPPRKPKPMAVAATPQIGDYQLPPLDFLNYPDTTVKPTESV
jgi:hypothetical protein